MKAKEIILLILIMGVGVLFYHAQTGKIHFDIDWEDGFLFLHEEFVFEESKELEPPFPAVVHIINAHGDVEIRGTEEEKITIFFQKKIWRRNEEQAKEFSDELKMNIDKETNQWTISTNRGEFRRKNFRTNFSFSLPIGMDVKVKNSYGLVKASKVGNTAITNRHGKTMASDIGGELSLQNSYRDVEAENVQAGCQIDSRHSHVYVNDVLGKTTVYNKYGKVHLENISDDVKVECSHTQVFGQNLMKQVEIESSYRKIALFDIGPTKILGHHSHVEVDGATEHLDIKDNYGSVKLSNIKGDLTVDGKNLSVSGKSIIGEKIYISSSYRNIDLSEFSGKTTIILSHGGIVLEPSPLTHPIEVKGEYVDIRFFWPPGGRYPFEARSKNGDVKWDLTAELSLLEENGATTAKAFLKERDVPSIFLFTTYGTIRIEE